MSPFTHPLCRHAWVWPMAGVKSKTDRILVVVTTLELDPEHKSHKTDKVARLRDAACDWMHANPEQATAVVLINRPRDWR